MAKDDKQNQEKRYGAPADCLASDAYPAVTTDPDAKNYVQVPRTDLPGNVPEGRFMVQLHKDELKDYDGPVKKGAKMESHPDENRPASDFE